MITNVKNAIIPEIGDSIQSKHLYSLAEAFNTRILSACGDAHWRIPHYIFSAWFRKPRLDDGMLYTPESEFFDFYQVVNPSTGETWPTSPPQQPEGANLQSNILNRFIFGMNYEERDSTGTWVYEREDVRAAKCQEGIRNSPSDFRGAVFPFFTAIGTASGTDTKYTAFGFASEIHSNGYINGNSINPQGNSFGGYYGKNPLILNAEGCGKASSTGYKYPKSVATIYKLDASAATGSLSVENVCNEGIGDENPPENHSIISSSNPNSYFIFEFNQSDTSMPVNFGDYLKSRHHLQQFLSTVYFDREQKNHIHRLLYNYITYAKGSDPSKSFDFDWFFRNQYDYAPEIGTFYSMKAIYNSENISKYDRKGIRKIEPRVYSARVSFVLNGLNSSSPEQYIPITNGHLAQIISSNAPAAQINLYGTDNQGKEIFKETISGVNSCLNYLYFNGFLAQGYEESFKGGNFLYKTESELIDGSYLLNTLSIPLGFTFHSFTVSAGQFKSFTIAVEIYVGDDKENFITRDFDFEGSQSVQTTRLQGFFATVFFFPELKLKFKVKNIILKPEHNSGSITVQPIFLFSYQPQIEDAYALLRACCYYGKQDGNLDSFNHPINGATKNISDDLQQYGFVTSFNIANTSDIHGPNDPEINNNGVYEASRRLSLLTRIINPNNLQAVLGKDILVFKRFVAQTYRGTVSNEVNYIDGAETSVIVSYGRSNVTNENGQSINSFNNIFFYSKQNLQPLLLTEPFKTINDLVTTCLDSYSYNLLKYDFTDRKATGQIAVELNATAVSVFDSKNQNYSYSKSQIEFQPTNFYIDFDAVLKTSSGIYLYKLQDLEGKLLPFAEIYDSGGNFVSQVGFDDSGKVNLQSIQGSFELFILSRRPDPTSLATAQIYDKSNYYYVDKNSEFISIEETGGARNILLRSNYEPKKAINMLGFDQSVIQSFETDEEILLKGAYYDENGTLINLAANPLVTDKTLTYVMNFEQLKTFCNNIYTSYSSGGLQLSKTEKTLSDKNPIFEPFDTFEKEEYNNFLANYSITFSHFSIKVTTNRNDYSIINPNTTIQIVYKNNNTVLSTDTCLLNAFYQLRPFSGDLSNANKIEFIIPVNNYKSMLKDPSISEDDGVLSGNLSIGQSYTVSIGSVTHPPQNGVLYNIGDTFVATANDFSTNNNGKVFPNIVETLPIYLAAKIGSFSQSNPGLTSINRDGTLYLSRSVKLINPNVVATIKRDLFQGIAPTLEGIPSGSLMKERSYIVLSGSIIHPPVTGIVYNAGDKFVASETQFTSNNAVVIESNGIVEEASPENFTNEWCMWMNFLPYSDFDTNIYKEEVYGATNSPFIDRCHINSDPLRRSEENNYLNLGLPRAYLPEAPPSYRYLPLQGVSKAGLVFENVVTEADPKIKESFYTSCQAFVPPYKIKNVYVDLNDLDLVYVKLDREIDGYKRYIDFDEKSQVYQTYRTDYNGLIDWLNYKGDLRFRMGDASLTNDQGVNQAGSGVGNGFSGSYYPRFFFLKLIPKPFMDGNATGDGDDSPLVHEHIKQAELYLEAMREGFTDGDSGSRGKLSCQEIKGILTPPDYKYDQLIFKSTSTSTYFGNKWPSLLTFSRNFNSSQNGVGPLRYLDNPKGYGSIPNLSTYTEPYVAIAKAVNNLTKFRVPYPFSYQGVTKFYQTVIPVNTEEWSNETYVRFRGSDPNQNPMTGPWWYNNSSPSQPQTANLISTVTLPVRNKDGALIPISAWKQYYIQSGNNNYSSVANAQIVHAKATTDLVITGLDSYLRTYAYGNLINLLKNASAFLPFSLIKSKTVDKLQPVQFVDQNDSCGSYYKQGGSKYVLTRITQVYDPTCEFKAAVTLESDDLPIGTPFFGVNSFQGCNSPTDSSFYNKSSFYADSSVSAYIHEPGFLIVEVPTIIDQTN